MCCIVIGEGQSDSPGNSTARVLASQAEAIVRTGKHGHNIE